MTHDIDTILGNINWECCDLVAQQTVIHLYIFMSYQRGGIKLCDQGCRAPLADKRLRFVGELYIEGMSGYKN